MGEDTIDLARIMILGEAEGEVEGVVAGATTVGVTRIVMGVGVRGGVVRRAGSIIIIIIIIIRTGIRRGNCL